MSYKVLLPSISLSADSFYNVLNSLKDNIKIISKEDMTKYKYGHKDKFAIYYNGKDQFICQAFLLNYLLGTDITDAFDGWKQFICNLAPEQNLNYETDVTGRYAYNYITKILRKYYTYDEIEAQLNSHTAEYDEKKKQVHIFYGEQGKITKFDNCIYYDINKAHSDALCEIFPKASKDLISMAKKSKQNKSYKKYPNYYCGYLVIVGHRLTYNWIVQRTTRILEERANISIDWDSDVVYANTDGIIISKPTQVFDTSDSIGQFKVEYTGAVYTYQGDNYQIVQYGDEIKGSLPLALRNHVDLRQNKVVKYRRKKTEYNSYEYSDIEEIIIKE